MLDEFGLDPETDYETTPDGHRIMKDGRTARVRMTMRDSARREIANQWWQTNTASAAEPWDDGLGDIVPDAVRRDPRYFNDARFIPQWDALAEAYKRRRIEDENAWRNPLPVVADAATDQSLSGEGPLSADADLLNPHSPRFDLARARQMRDAAYEQREAEDLAAWRKGK